MKRKHLLLTLLLALMVPLAVNAQVSFPFDEDFDDIALFGTYRTAGRHLPLQDKAPLR